MSNASALRESEMTEVSFTLAAPQSEAADLMKQAIKETAEHFGATWTIVESKDWLVQFRWADAADSQG